MHKGKLIVLEGLDCSFKETNSKRLYKHYKQQGKKVKLFSFPNYNSESSKFIKAHLNGDFGQAYDMPPYLVALFYTIDRGITNITEKIKEYYDQGYIIILDRYTTSNMIFQGSKLNKDELKEFIEWIKNLEYNKINLPKPDVVIYMDMPYNLARRIISERKNKNGEENDIYEDNSKFMNHVREVAKEVIKLEDWKVVKCNDGNNILDRETLFKNVLKEVDKYV